MATTRRRIYARTEEHSKIVKALSSYGVQQDEIAKVLAIDPKTLRKYYREELDSASVLANSKVAEALFNNATKKNNVTAQIFWMKTRAKWREIHPVESEDELKNAPVAKLVVEVQDPATVIAERKRVEELERQAQEAANVVRH